MLKLNEEAETIEIVESLSFDCHVQPRLNEIRGDLEYDMDCFDEDKQENLKYFLNKKDLSREDRIKILKEIQEYFEAEDNYYADISVFNDRIIDEGIYRWIEETFEVDIRP